MQENFWKDKYPEGVPLEIDPSIYPDIFAVFQESCKKFADRPAFSNMGKTLTYADLDRYSADFASYLQNHTDLQLGDCVALQMPNLLQYPIALFGCIRAGMRVTNTNPLYTVREMEHQFNDAGAVALVCLSNMAHLAEQAAPHTRIRHLIITDVGDMLPQPKRFLVNFVVRHIKQMVPAYNLPQATPFLDVLRLGHLNPVKDQRAQPKDVAVLQYTGGTTGVAKGAMLTHRNLIANMVQGQAYLNGFFDDGSEVVIAPLPLYHVFAFTLHCMILLLQGGHNVLITNPRDLPSLIRELRKWKFTVFVGLNTLFVSLCNDRSFRRLDFSTLKATVSGGMALQKSTADLWKEVTGCQICEGYGMTETSPVISLNPMSAVRIGTVGMPFPSTQCRTVDEEGNEVPLGEPGELCVKGPQVMRGYWNRPEETAEVFDTDGWLRTGDIAVIQPDGYIRIVDRRKDLIIVSGFNVYPNELEDVLAAMPGVLQCAAIGVPSDRTGEAIKMFVVPKPGSGLAEEAVKNYMHDNLTGYKRPRMLEFRESLPTSNVGKVLRRELRNEELKKIGHI